MAYSLSVPFASTLVFASIMKHQDAPGTTFKKHMAIARGLLSEDDYLLTEILFNPKTPAQIDNIVATLTHLWTESGKTLSKNRTQYKTAGMLPAVFHIGSIR